ncbi:hypothetical protein [Corynebacterium timonense]|uniref:Alkaline shock response membrane anchor protein AmaP n=1 Tax=Corynebacterium timonense TaxID=441500 RepID=A0A1H1SU81_9CORY|nr:hypothetical protein [Corynebacterium timonense]SDS51494.1 hypothetical protein SAMN04488539_1824 [Corynebacterium timonense]
MTRRLAALNRIVTFLVGVLLVAAGVVPAALYWDIPVLSERVTRIDRSLVAGLPEQRWFFAAAVAALVLLLVLGLWLIVANVRSHAFDHRTVTRTQPVPGSTVVNVRGVGAAACSALESHPMVSSASCAVAYVGPEPTATFTVVTDPALPLREAAALLDETDAQLADALEGIDLRTVYKVELERITR